MWSYLFNDQNRHSFDLVKGRMQRKFVFVRGEGKREREREREGERKKERDSDRGGGRDNCLVNRLTPRMYVVCTNQ